MIREIAQQKITREAFPKLTERGEAFEILVAVDCCEPITSLAIQQICHRAKTPAIARGVTAQFDFEIAQAVRADARFEVLWQSVIDTFTHRNVAEREWIAEAQCVADVNS